MSSFHSFQRIRPSAERELAVLSDVLHQCDHKSTRVGEWDLFYLTEMYKVLPSLLPLSSLIPPFNRCPFRRVPLDQFPLPCSLNSSHLEMSFEDSEE